MTRRGSHGRAGAPVHARARRPAARRRASPRAPAAHLARPRSGVASASTVGPAPDSTAGTPAARSSATEPSVVGHRLGAGRAGAAGPRSRASSSSGSPARAATSSAARPALATASACVTDVGQQRPGDLGVHRVGGHQHDRDQVGPTSSRTAGTRPRPRPGDREPAETGRRDVVRVAFEPRGEREQRVVVEPRGPALDQGPGQHEPATIAAEEDPRPRPCGIALRAVQPQPGRRDAHRRRTPRASRGAPGGSRRAGPRRRPPLRRRRPVPLVGAPRRPRRRAGPGPARGVEARAEVRARRRHPRPSPGPRRGPRHSGVTAGHRGQPAASAAAASRRRPRRCRPGR